MTSFDDFAAELNTRLIASAGGYLRNTIRATGVTCTVCLTPVSESFKNCAPCNKHRYRTDSRTADHVGILSYAVASNQSHYVMRNYKAPVPVREHQNIVIIMAFLGLFYHLSCLNKLSDRPVSHWASVPSLPAKPGEHPLHRIIQSILNSYAQEEIELLAAPKDEVSDPRAFRHQHFRAPTTPPGSHVLIIEDTWVQGGHPQSAAAAVREAGAAEVSILTIARFLKPDFGENEKFVQQHLTRDYDPHICPWIEGECP